MTRAVVVLVGGALNGFLIGLGLSAVSLPSYWVGFGAAAGALAGVLVLAIVTGSGRR